MLQFKLGWPVRGAVVWLSCDFLVPDHSLVWSGFGVVWSGLAWLEIESVSS